MESAKPLSLRSMDELDVRLRYPDAANTQFTISKSSIDIPVRGGSMERMI